MLGGTTEMRDLVDRLPVCFRWRVCRLVRSELYWLYLERTSLSMEFASCGLIKRDLVERPDEGGKYAYPLQ